VLGGGEVFLAREVPASSLSRAEREGVVRRLARGLYTTNVADPPEQVVRRNLWRIAGLLFPGAVLGDRSVRDPSRPGEDGSVYLMSPDVSERGRTVELPGLSLRVRRGPGAIAHDAPLPGGIYLSSTARGLLENARLTRGRGERISRTLSHAELEEWLERLLDERGEERFLELRDQAREIAPLLGLEQELQTLDALFGAVLGTRTVRAQSPLLRARQQGLPYDDRRLQLFDALHAELSALAPRSRPSPPDAARVRYLPFFDAYFSNYIEGTEFTVEEAREIVFERIVPPHRPADAHDVLGTYALVSDRNEMRRLPRSLDDYLDILRNRHRRMMGQRPEAQPGEFKTQANRAGSTIFVDPSRVRGTLAKGYALYETLLDPFARAVFQMFLVSEVHPFLDGNGRMARMMANAELIAAGEELILVPSVYRIEYLGALRALSANGFADRLPRVLDFAQRYTHAIDFSDFDQAVSQLSSTNALVDADEAEREGIRLRMPPMAEQ
jgi:fido (protein-threonine AMPylation protein)